MLNLDNIFYLISVSILITSLLDNVWNFFRESLYGNHGMIGYILTHVMVVQRVNKVLEVIWIFLLIKHFTLTEFSCDVWVKIKNAKSMYCLFTRGRVKNYVHWRGWRYQASLDLYSWWSTCTIMSCSYQLPISNMLQQSLASSCSLLNAVIISWFGFQ